jgi:hypothetical protein
MGRPEIADPIPITTRALFAEWGKATWEKKRDK